MLNFKVILYYPYTLIPAGISGKCKIIKSFCYTGRMSEKNAFFS